ncbi:MAG: hypothetical protein US94_C0014G0002 [Berkelbacteria bacterium GW2011_GWB1_38_5]|uniref:Transposase IS200-like domain-containing protein n=1 Tax=Berkelbacteria bacterium GW2011_GWB1_38_5 TaxID=1618336 RepID=A0A0G0MK68_9BACT|nr:MAG: hypothetical protein US94_C0014G0002 [Berkelbacteria bacterium GW2011_GWB1_38_5]
MNIRKDPLKNDYYYHIFSRSIAKFVVFNDADDYSRFVEILNLYHFVEFDYKYSQYNNLSESTKSQKLKKLTKSNLFWVEIVAFCVMPTHIHLILKQKIDGGISKYIGKVLNSYTRYFNLRHQRKGPLWEARFKSVLVDSDEQILHLTRYIHLNPTSAGLVKNTSDWHFSSYHEYIQTNRKDHICIFKEVIDYSPEQYRKFVLDRKSYQREISLIKNSLIDDYTG